MMWTPRHDEKALRPTRLSTAGRGTNTKLCGSMHGEHHNARATSSEKGTIEEVLDSLQNELFPIFNKLFTI
jgi:hypothetical protein